MQEKTNEIRQILNKKETDNIENKRILFSIVFYKFISQKTVESFKKITMIDNYYELDDNSINTEIIDKIKKENGYFLYPSELIINAYKKSNEDKINSNKLLKTLKSIESSAFGYDAEKNFNNIFSEIIEHLQLKIKANESLELVERIINSANKLDWHIDSTKNYPDAYDLIFNEEYKKNDKYYFEKLTPRNISSLVSKLALRHNKKNIKIYDPIAGCGEVLLSTIKEMKLANKSTTICGFEQDLKSRNISVMKFIMSDVNLIDFKIFNKISDAPYKITNKYDVIFLNFTKIHKKNIDLENNFIPKENLEILKEEFPIDDAEVLILKNALDSLSSQGICNVLCFSSSLHNLKQLKIRQYLIEKNLLESVIELPENSLYGTSVRPTLLTISKKRKDNKVIFFNVEKLFENNNECLSQDSFDEFNSILRSKKNIDHVIRSVSYEEIKDKNYNLHVSAYIEKKSIGNNIDMIRLKADLKNMNKQIQHLQNEMNNIICRIENKPMNSD